MTTPEHFATRLNEIATARGAVETKLAESQNELTDARVAKDKLEAEAAEINGELRSLRERKNNIPMRQLDVRALLCRELRVADDTLPFVGELIAVRPEEADWEGRPSACCTPLRFPSSSPTITTARFRTGSTDITCASALSTTGFPPRRWPAGSSLPLRPGHPRGQARGEGHAVRPLAGTRTGRARRRAVR